MFDGKSTNEDLTILVKSLSYQKCAKNIVFASLENWIFDGYPTRADLTKIVEI